MRTATFKGSNHAAVYIDFLETVPGIYLRYGVWRCRGADHHGSVLLLNGRCEFLEKHLDSVSQLNRRGFDVFSIDWRGQGLSTRLLPDGRKGYVDTFEDYLNDLSCFMRKVVRPRLRPPLLIVGHSMGGHLALRYLREYAAGQVAGCILISPMVDIITFPVPRGLARALAHWAVHRGNGPAYALMAAQYAPEQLKFEGNRLTSDRHLFNHTQQLMRANPDLILGGVTYQWLHASFESIARLQTAGYIEQIKSPVLVAIASCDRIIPRRAQQHLGHRLPRGRCLLINGARHEILREKQEYRLKFWQAFDKFAAEALAKRPVLDP